MKYKMIIIDDEMVILQGLKKLLDWKELNIEIVGEAMDGEQGLYLIEQKKPDIVISDIAMPNLSGIEMLKKVNDNGWNIKLIFLSGYQEFSYAREAVRYGASDYLLKPVGANELYMVVERTIQQIISEKSVHVLKKKDGIGEVIFQEILQQKRKNENLEEFMRSIEWRKANSEAVCVAFRVIVKGSISAEENRNLIRFEIYEFIQEYLDKKGIGKVIRKEFNSCYCLLFIPNDRKNIRNLIGKLTQQISLRYSADIIAGVGAWTDGEGKVTYLYKTAKFALELYYFEESRYIDYEEIQREYNHSLEEYQEGVKKIKQKIIMNDNSEEIVSDIIKSIQLLRMLHYGNKNAVINSAILLAGEIFSVLKECALVQDWAEEEQAQFLEDIRKKSTFQSLLSLFKEHYSRIFLKIRLLYRQRETGEIMRVKQYIQEHYKENITLEEIADYIGMNASYMSVFFKKETGKNFKVYLTEIRMKEAVKLINSTNMKNYELAEAVGYKDVKQFREKFREIYGMSPQQYRKRGNF